MACKAIGAIPTVALFRCFYHLAKNGDWLTIQRRKDPSCQFVFPSNPTLKNWKNRFFWVSYAILPFPPLFRNPRDPLFELELRHSLVNYIHYKLLVANKTHIRAFPKEVLVLAGLSGKWALPEMGLLDIMKLDTNSDVESSSRTLLEGEEDVVTSHLRTCYTGQEYTSVLPDAGVIRTELPSFEVPNVEAVPKRKKAIQGKGASDTAAPSKRMKTRASKGKAPIVPSDEGVHSVSSGNTVEETVRSEKALMNSPEKTSASSEHETTHLAKSFSLQPFVPLWDVCNGDLYDNPKVCRDVATALPTPGQRAAVAQLSNTALTDELLTSWVRLGSFVTESLNRWSGCHDQAKEKTTILLNKLNKAGERISALEQQLVDEKKQASLRAEEMKEEMRVREAQLSESREEVEKGMEALAEGRVALEEERKSSIHGGYHLGAERPNEMKNRPSNGLGPKDPRPIVFIRWLLPHST
ncbi:hypothetical protein R6Q59_031819 [Mikania micrantha]